MKNLMEHLSEKLNESSNLIVMAFNHDNPETTYIIKNMSSKDLSKLNKYGMETCELQNAKGVIVGAHSDENPWMANTDMKDLNAIKKYCWDTWKENESHIENNSIDDVNFEDICVTMDFDDTKKIKNADNLWKEIEKWFNETEVDGDSASGYSLIDIEKNQEICGSLSPIFYDSMEEFVKDFNN